MKALRWMLNNTYIHVDGWHALLFWLLAMIGIWKILEVIFGR